MEHFLAAALRALRSPRHFAGEGALAEQVDACGAAATAVARSEDVCRVGPVVGPIRDSL